MKLLIYFFIMSFLMLTTNVIADSVQIPVYFNIQNNSSSSTGSTTTNVTVNPISNKTNITLDDIKTIVGDIQNNMITKNDISKILDDKLKNIPFQTSQNTSIQNIYNYISNYNFTISIALISITIFSIFKLLEFVWKKYKIPKNNAEEL